MFVGSRCVLVAVIAMLVGGIRVILPLAMRADIMMMRVGLSIGAARPIEAFLRFLDLRFEP